MNKLIFLVGSPRSGTTWLAKMFDSHSNTLYRHEPDSILVSESIPFCPEVEKVSSHLGDARQYLSMLTKVRASKSAGTLPAFRKKYRPFVIDQMRLLFLFGVKFVEKILSSTGLSTEFQIPDFLTERGKDKAVIVIKSVNSLTRTRLFSLACKDARFIHIIRHPCAFVASELRGEKMGFMSIGSFTKAQASMIQAKKRGFTLEKLDSMTLEQQLASLWMLQNEKVMEEMGGASNYKLVVYEELCVSPEAVCNDLFAFSGLEEDEQTAEFIQQSLNHENNGNERYFQVVRDPNIAANKWKKELTGKQIRDISDIVKDSLPGRMFY